MTDHRRITQVAASPPAVRRRTRGDAGGCGCVALIVAAAAIYLFWPAAAAYRDNLVARLEADTARLKAETESDRATREKTGP